AEAIAEFYRMFGSRQDVERDLERIRKELAEGEWETDPTGMRNSPSRLSRTMSAPWGKPTSTMRFPTTAAYCGSAISTKSLFMRSTGSKSRG
ncbi:MAG: hypothetical protein ACREP8_02510, partial [Candidatus Binatia bacterium]